MPKDMKFKCHNVSKLPPNTIEERQAIAVFLEYIRTKTELNLNNHRVFAMTDKSARTLGMVRHYRSQLGTIVFLQSINDQHIPVEPSYVG